MPYTQSSLAVPKKPVTIAVQDKGTVSAEAMSRYTAARAGQSADAPYTTSSGIAITLSETSSGQVATLFKEGKALTSFNLTKDTRVSWDENGAPVITQGSKAVTNGVLRGMGDNEILIRVSSVDVLAGGNGTTILNLSETGGTFTGGEGGTKFLGDYMGSTVIGGAGANNFAGVFTNSAITGGTASDVFSGIFASSTVKGGDGGDVFSGLFLMQSTIMGEAGDDKFTGQFVDSNLSGGDGDDSFGSDIVADLAKGIRADFTNVTIDMGDGKNRMKGTALSSSITGGKGDDSFSGIFVESTVSTGQGDSSISAALAVGSLFRGEGGDDSVTLYTATGNTVDMGEGENSIRIGQDTSTGTWSVVRQDEGTAGEHESIDLVNEQTSFTLGTQTLQARTANGNVVRGQNKDAMLFETGPVQDKKLKSGTSSATRAFAAYAMEAEHNNGFILPE